MFSRVLKFLYNKENRFDRSMLLLALSLACGISALVGVETFSRRVQSTVSRDSKKILAADFQVQSWRPFDNSVWSALSEEKQRGDTVVLYDFVSSLSYTQNLNPITSTVSVRAIEGSAYPFYGDLILSPQLPLTRLGEDKYIVLDKSFRSRGVELGSSVQLGDSTFKVLAFLMEEPQSVAGAFALGPRVMISSSFLQETGLVRPGSRVFHRLLVRTPLSTESFEKKFREKAPDLHWRIMTPESSNRQAERILTRMTGFLSFVGISSLFLGAVGLFMVFRSQFMRKLPSYLTLKCLGLKNETIIKGALFSSLRVAMVGAFVGIFIGLGAESLLAYFAQEKLGVSLGTVSWLPSFFWGVFLSLVCVVISVLIPLREILAVPVSNAIREEGAGATGLKIIDAVAALASAIFLVFLVGPKFQISLAIIGGIFLAVILLYLLSHFLLKVFSRLTDSFSSRHAFLQLLRKKLRTQLLVIAFGMSLFFLFLILLLGHSLRQQLNRVQSADVPNVFAINVSPDSRDRLAELLPQANFVPVTQARIVELRGKPIVEGEVPLEGAERFYQTREYVVTKRDVLSVGEELVEGASLFGVPRSGWVRVSLEKQFADRMRLKINDEFKVDIAGVSLKAVVSSLRSVNWFNFQPNFFMIFNPQDLEGAPMDFVALARVPSPDIEKYQSLISKELSQVSLIDAEDVAARILKILEQLSVAIYSVTLFSLVGSFFVLFGIFLSRRVELLKELALWRCLGLRHQKLLRIYFYESIFVGLISSLASLLSALLVVWVICVKVLDIPMVFPSLLWILPLLVLPTLFSASLVLGILKKYLRQSSQSLFRLAEESFN